MAQTTPQEATDWGRVLFGYIALLFLIGLIIYSIYLDPTVLTSRQDELWLLAEGFIIAGAAVFGMEIVRKMQAQARPSA